MKPRIVCGLLAGGVVAAAAWFVQPPTHAQVEPVPPQYLDTVSKGLAYLAKNQAKDGHFESDGGDHPVAMTGLAGLALHMAIVVHPEGGFPRKPREARYSANTRQAADWLMAKSRRDGLIFSGHASETSRYMEGHGLATLFLAGVLGKESDAARRRKLDAVLTPAVRFIVKAQSSQGGWYRTARLEGHDFDEVLSTVIQIQALQAAENAGIVVPPEVLSDGQQYLKAALAKNDAPGNPVTSSNRPLATAAALACKIRQSEIEVLRAVKDDWCQKGFALCRAKIPVGKGVRFGRDELVHHYYAQSLFNGPEWVEYRTMMFDRLQQEQDSDGGLPAAEGLGVGRVYATALWCVVLQLDNLSHPSALRTPIAVD